MNMNTDLGSSQFDSDEEELEDFEEDLMLLVAAAATTFVFFTAEGGNDLARTFRDPVFKQAAKKLNRFHEKGAKKTSISCRSKWTRLKRTYKVVTALKSLAESGFVWDDVKGMGVTPEKRPAWDELVKSNKHFKPFATKGWPHYDAMARLMPFRARSAYTRLDTHIPTAATMSTSGLSPPPAPLDVLSAHSSIPSSCKRKLSSFDTSTQSSYSTKRRMLSPENALALERLTASVISFNTACREFTLRYAYAPAPPPLPAPTSSIARKADAIERFLESIRESEERGDKWLSTEDVHEMIGIFMEDATAPDAYITVADASNEDGMRSWVRSQLESTGAQRGGNS
ncbi:hypothetical protein BGY98DRAFT_1100725 [Russula aff. rugulosa BPL654]|nr:hypothetical protein BGY98DRAFT_1100725 [Russula aff. rugulosa BPL654]